MVQARTLRFVFSHDTPILVSINSLEYATQWITMLGCHLHFDDSTQVRHDPHPIFLLKDDNMTGESCLKKGCTSSPIGHSLTRLQAMLLLRNGAGYCFGSIYTKSNFIADGISCIPLESSLSHKFPKLLAQAPSLNGCQHFLLSLKCHVVSARPPI